MYPSPEGQWKCVDESFGEVTAGVISHNVTTFGYVYHERDQPGNLHAETVMPLLKKNEEELRRQGLSIYNVIKRFKVVASIWVHCKQGERFRLPDATVLDPENMMYISPTKRGRKVCVLGDTRSARRLSSLIRGSDLLVHEATIGPIAQDLLSKGNGLSGSSFGFISCVEEMARRQLEKGVHVKGHSTAVEAARFARELEVKTLVLNHISNRYDYIDEVHYREASDAIRDVAVVGADWRMDG